MSTAVRVDPRTMAERITRLFISNGNPGAAIWFDRTLVRSPRPDAACWISTDDEDRVIAHIAALPTRLVHDGRELRGAILCNLMADRAHRTFFPILAVVKRAVRDLREEGAELIMTNPGNAGAVAVMKAAGLKQVAIHSRFLGLLGDRRRVVDLVIGMTLGGRRLLCAPPRARSVDPVVAAEWTVRNLSRISPVTARRAPGQYAQRYEAFGSAGDEGFIFTDSRGAEIGAAIVRCEPGHDDAALITLRSVSAASIPGIAAALGSALRSHGVRRLNALAVVGSSYARGLLRGGFIARDEPWAIAGVGFTDAAKAALAAMGDSDLERVDFD